MQPVRARGSGTLRADGRWQSIIRIDGKKVTVIEKTQRAMQAEVRRLRNEGVPSKQTLAAAYAEWIALKIEQRRDRGGDKHPTIRAYRQSMAPALKELGWKAVARITPKDVDLLCLELGNNRRSQMTREVLRNLFGWCIRQGTLKQNVAELAEPVRVRKKNKARLTPAAFAAIMEHADNQTVALFFYTLAETGLRPYKEAIHIKRDDLTEDDAGWWIWIPDSKTDSGVREVPITQGLYVALKESGTGGLVFPSEAGTRLAPRNVMRTWMRWQEKRRQATQDEDARAKMPHYDVYAVRHLFGSVMSTKTRDRVLQQIMGHADIRTTRQHYDHPTREEIARTVKEKKQT